MGRLQKLLLHPARAWLLGFKARTETMRAQIHARLLQMMVANDCGPTPVDKANGVVFQLIEQLVGQFPAIWFTNDQRLLLAPGTGSKVLVTWVTGGVRGNPQYRLLEP